jgi:hypothetical protein
LGSKQLIAAKTEREVEREREREREKNDLGQVSVRANFIIHFNEFN